LDLVRRNPTSQRVDFSDFEIQAVPMGTSGHVPVLPPVKSGPWDLFAAGQFATMVAVCRSGSDQRARSSFLPHTGREVHCTTCSPRRHAARSSPPSAAAVNFARRALLLIGDAYDRLVEASDDAADQASWRERQYRVESELKRILLKGP
jgi:hypothetical protein